MRFKINIWVDGYDVTDEGGWRPAKVVETVYWKDPSNQLMQPAQAMQNLAGSFAQAFAGAGCVNILDEHGKSHLYFMQHVHKIDIEVADALLSPN